MLWTQPIEVGGITLHNRLVMPPMATAKSTPEGAVTQDLLDYYRQRTAGGNLGLVITEHSFVCPQGKATNGQMSLAEDALIPGLKALADVIHAGGAAAFAQINHAGGMALPEISGHEVVSASAVLNPGRQPAGVVPRALSAEEIAEIEEQFVSAAKRVKAAGFDGVEIHSAHAYLLNEFYSPLTNHRTDDYGGPLENRIRIHVEIIRKIRSALGEDYPIALRLGGCDYMDGGSTIEDAVEACRTFQREGVCLLDISGGMCRYIRKDNTQPGYFASTSRAVMSSATVPVLLTGGITTVDQMESFLRQEAADLIGVGRALIKDPHWADSAAAQSR